MADFDSSLPIRTQVPGDVVVGICDATVPSQQIAINASGQVLALDGSDGSVTGGTVAGFSSLAGGQYNTVLPTLTDTQQAAFQLDSSGHLLVSATITFPYDENYGAVGASTLRTAAQIGNATGAADFDVGAIGAQTLRTAAEISNASGLADFDAGATGAQTLRTVSNQGAPNSAANAWPMVVTSGGSVNGPTNPLYVTDSDVTGTSVNSYKDASAIAAGASDSHDYTVTAGKTLYLSQVEASSSGKAKMILQVETGVATGVFNPYFAQFNSSASPSMSIHLEAPIPVAAGVRVRVVMSNRDLLAEDLYSTISGSEI